MQRIIPLASVLFLSAASTLQAQVSYPMLMSVKPVAAQLNNEIGVRNHKYA